jgi:hypothetical protein
MICSNDVWCELTLSSVPPLGLQSSGRWGGGEAEATFSNMTIQKMTGRRRSEQSLVRIVSNVNFEAARGVAFQLETRNGVRDSRR